MSSARGAALTRQTRFSAYWSWANTVLAPTSVSNAPTTSDHTLRSSLPVLAMTVSVSAAPSSPMRVHLAVGEEHAGQGNGHEQ